MGGSACGGGLGLRTRLTLLVLVLVLLAAPAPAEERRWLGRVALGTADRHVFHFELESPHGPVWLVVLEQPEGDVVPHAERHRWPELVQAADGAIVWRGARTTVCAEARRRGMPGFRVSQWRPTGHCEVLPERRYRQFDNGFVTVVAPEDHLWWRISPRP